MAFIDTLIERVDDPDLRRRITDEVAKLVARTQFGLVFQDHLPEDIQVPGVRPRRGDVVRERAATERTDFVVVKTSAGIATTLPLTAGGGVVAGAERSEIPFEQLVVVKDFSQPIYPGLRQVGSIDRGGDKNSHAVINGENYCVLETLLYTHENKVDVIYIDPPYNTGSADWLYNDKYIDQRDNYRHSKWLAFMERRLRHAKRLLKDFGVIFVSIDDNEQAHLRMLMDRVFGESNFVETIAVEMSTTSGPKVVNAQQGTIVKNVEFVHIFKKSDAFDRIAHTPLFDGVAAWDANYKLWLEQDGTVGSFLTQLANDPMVHADMLKFGLLRKGKFSVKSMDRLLTVSEAAATFIEANAERIARTDRVPVGVSHFDVETGRHIDVETESRTYSLTRVKSGTLMQVMSLARNYRMSDDYKPRYGRTVIRGDLWKGFHSDMAHVGLEGGIAFGNGKKPIRLLRQLIRWANNSSDAVILDFFGGSGTTTHAVMEMNAMDGGRRQSILVTNNEVSKAESQLLRGAGHFPGDPEFEALGVFNAVTKPRLEAALTGVKADGTVIGPGYDENMQFLELTYEDENLIALGRKFDAIAPLLWLKSGARGPVISTIDDKGWALPEATAYGVLFDTAHAREFMTRVSERGQELRQLFIVTDSEGEFQAVLSLLGKQLWEIHATRLYSDYLRSFEINGKD